MSERRKDYLYLALGLSSPVAVALVPLALVAGVVWLTTFLICFAATSAPGTVMVLHEIWMHGIHNDR